jgi:hypothetical protein
MPFQGLLTCLREAIEGLLMLLIFARRRKTSFILQPVQLPLPDDLCKSRIQGIRGEKSPEHHNLNKPLHWEQLLYNEFFFFLSWS